MFRSRTQPQGSYSQWFSCTCVILFRLSEKKSPRWAHKDIFMKRTVIAVTKFGIVVWFHLTFALTDVRFSFPSRRVPCW